MKKILCLLLIILASCSSTPRHSILGSTYGWDNPDGEIKIISDIEISDLKLRHVRKKNAKCSEGFSEHIELSGPIGPDSTGAIERLLKRLQGGCYATTVYLNSPGGLLEHGFKLGALFKRYGVQTIVTGEQVCASSCAFAFLGGRFRTMAHDAKLSFHAPYLSRGMYIDCTDTGQVAKLETYFKANLGKKTGEYLLDRTMSYCSVNDGWTINKDAADLFGLLTS